MTLLPIVRRELSLASRRLSTYAVRTTAAFVAMLALAGLLLFALVMPGAQQGRMLFTIMSGLAFAYCLFAGVRMTADCLSEEKREGTLQLLFLTDLKGYDVILGKLVSSSLSICYNLMAILPVIGVSMMLGGVAYLEVARMSLVLGTTLLFSLSVGMLVSAFSLHERKAMMGAFFLIVILTLAPVWIAFYLQQKFNTPLVGPIGLDPDFLQSTPLLPFVLTQFPSPTGRLFSPQFFSPISLLLLQSLLFLGIAGVALPRSLADQSNRRWVRWWLNLQQRLIYGAGARRAALRARMLDANAFYWLASRDQMKMRNVWVLMGGIVGTWIFGMWRYPEMVFDTGAVLVLCMFVLIKIWVTSEVCMRMVEDRRSGALELLLSTPLGVADIARGQLLALWRQFARPVALALLFGLAVLFAGRYSPRADSEGATPQYLAGAGLLLLDIWTIRWVALWVSLHGNNVGRAVRACMSRVMALPWILYWLFLTFTDVYGKFLPWPRFDFSSTDRVWIWFGIGVYVDLVLIVYSKWRFLNQCRQVATQRFDKESRGRGVIRTFIGDLAGALREKRAERKASRGPRSLALRLWWVWTPLAGLLIVAACMGWRRMSVRRELSARVEVLRKAGYPSSEQEFFASRGAVPLTRNAELKLRESLGSLVTIQRPRRGRLANSLNGTPRWMEAGSELTMEMRTFFSNSTQLNAQALKLAHEAAAFPECQFSEPRPQMLWRNLSDLGELLLMECWVRMDEGKVDDAAKSVRTLLALARCEGSEPRLELQRLRQTHIRSAVEALESVFSRGTPPGETLALLDQELARAGDDRFIYQTLLRAQALGLDLFKDPYKGTMPARVGPVFTPEAIKLMLEPRVMSLTGELDRQAMAFMDQGERVLQAARMASWTQRLQEIRSLGNQSIVSMEIAYPVRGVASVFLYPDNIFRDEAGAVGRLRLARCAVALERIRLGEGKVSPAAPKNAATPETWLNPFDGKDFFYEVHGDGYAISEVPFEGVNKMDPAMMRRYGLMPPARYASNTTNGTPGPSVVVVSNGVAFMSGGNSNRVALARTQAKRILGRPDLSFEVRRDTSSNSGQ